MKKYKINVMKWNLEKYNTTPSFYEKFQILLLMENANTHLVSVFKDYLLFDDMTEFFKEYYISKDIYPRLKTIYDYYESSSYLFPNYTAIDEGKYIYRNIIRKQKLIDYLEDLEDKKKEKEEKRKNRKKQNQTEESSSYIEVFDTKVYDSIRKETGNDSKINELFCVENRENSDDYDSFASIAKLTEIIKEKDKEINKVKKENNINFNINNNSNKKNNNNNNSNKEHSYNLNNKYNGIGIETKIFVSRRININQTNNNNNKKYLKKPENISINNFINNNYSSSSNSAKKKINGNSSGKFKNIITDPNKNIDFNKNSQGNINKKVNTTTSNVISNKNGYKKNNIIINIINNNKNNNYQSNNNYYSNYTNNNTNENNVNKNNYFQNNTNNVTAENKNNNISSNNSSKSNNNINSHFKKTNNIIKNQISSKGLIGRNSNSNNSKKIIQRAKKEIKSKLLPFRMNTDIQPSESNLIQNLTERLKNQSQSSSLKKSTEQSKMQNFLSPNANDKKTNKRTKTEILGKKNDIILFGQQSENNNYNKSINRQILKNINITNSNKAKKEISLINKKICSYHFKTNSNSNNSKSKIKSKYIKHSSTNSQNLTGIGIGINKIGMLQIKEIIKKKREVFPFNKTERTSRNHSKDKMNKMINHTGKRNFKDSFSPKKSQELIYNKIHKSQNKNNTAIICSFLKNVHSNKKIKSTKFKNNNSNINYKSVNFIKDKNN